MNLKEIRLIDTFCRNNMNVSATANALHIHRNSVAYQMDKIAREYQLDPRCYFELKELEALASEAAKDYPEYMEEKEMPGKTTVACTNEQYKTLITTS